MDLNRPAAVLALSLSVFAFAACGESAEEKAKAQVCGARSDISKQVASLSGLTLSTASIDQVKTGLEAIANDVKKIKDAQSSLNPARKQQVEGATSEFTASLTTIASGLASSLSLSGAETQLKGAVAKLGESYRKTLAPIDCS